MAQQKVTAILSGTYAWDMQNDMPVPLTRPYLDGVAYSDLRQLELALTPHGALRAALAATNATAITQPIVGAPTSASRSSAARSRSSRSACSASTR